MIPLTLQIKNFLSYGDPIQTIEFGNYSLICLSGKNGHGKSALLDAITWALWGQARKIGGTAKADQGLLRLGQTQMMVCFDFECGGQRYRVKREYMQTYGKPVALLEFGLLEAESNKFLALTEKTLRDTQAKIDQTLHLTFDGFTNSAFLRQGQANEFSKKSPKERKEVLSTILGLDRYENIRRLAAERVKHAQTQKLSISTVLAKLEQALAQSAELEQKEQTLQNEEKEIALSEKQTQEINKNYEHSYKAYELDKQKCSMLKFQKNQFTQEQTKYSSQLNQLFHQWRQIHRQLLSQTNYSDLEKQKQLLVTTIATYQQQLQEHLNVQQMALITKERLNVLVQNFHQQKSVTISQQIISLERLHGQLTHQQTNIQESLIRKSKIEAALQSAQKEYNQLVAQMPKETLCFEKIEKQFEKRKEHYQQWIALANMVSTQLNSNAKKNLLVIDEESPSCPLCEQNLSAARKRFLKKKFEDDSIFLTARFNKLSRLIKKLKTILIEQHVQIEQITKQQQIAALLQQSIQEQSKKITHLETELAEITATLAKQQEMQVIISKTIMSEEAALKTNQSSIQKELANLPDFQELSTTLESLEKQRNNPVYNKQQHEKASQELLSIEKALQEFNMLQEQKAIQAQRSEQISTWCAQLRTLKKQIASLDSEIKSYDQLDQIELKLVEQKKHIEQLKTQITHKKEVLLQEKGSIEQQRIQLQQVKKEYEDYQKQLANHTLIIDDYQAIANATGKDGIQALLIEDAIPEIEQEANILLSKLTENQTQLFIDSLRDLKKGGTKETLDIKISDSVGIRPYELFSGGEAFRIDFALRIAISKLLARRSGTSLQTLIIDEGFGSQDDEGLSHIMDALYKIQEDFAKIIIVSHLNSMKNQFPVHFVIEKGPQGSQVHVMEQG